VVDYYTHTDEIYTNLLDTHQPVNPARADPQLLAVDDRAFAAARAARVRRLEGGPGGPILAPQAVLNPI
jgi:hypothetical protein